MWALTHYLNSTTVLLQPEETLLKGCPADLGRQDLHTPCPVPAAEAPHTGHFITQKTVSQPGTSWHVNFLLKSFWWHSALTLELFLNLLWAKEIVHLIPFLFHTVLFSPLPSSQLPTMDRRQEH